MGTDNIRQFRMPSTCPGKEEFRKRSLSRSGWHGDAEQTDLPFFQPLQCPCQREQLLSPGHIELLVFFAIPFDISAEAIEIPRSIEQKRIPVYPQALVPVFLVIRLKLGQISTEHLGIFMGSGEVIRIIFPFHLDTVRIGHCHRTVLLDLMDNLQCIRKRIQVTPCPFTEHSEE